MKPIGRADLADLLSYRGDTCASVYLPTPVSAPGNVQDPIRLKNLVRQLEGYLMEAGFAETEAVAYTAPARELLDDRPFWRHRAEGLALFLAPGFLRTLRVPLAFQEQVVVSRRFHLKPLLSLLTSDAHFTLLALAQNEIRLYEGSRGQLLEVPMPEVPHNLKESFAVRGREQPSEQHLGWSYGGSSIHGNEKDTSDADLATFLRLVERGLQDRLREGGAPLVLWGVERLLAVYRRVNTYQGLLVEGIEGNPEARDTGTLHAQAWPLVQRNLDRRRSEAVAHLQNAATNTVSTDLRAVLSASTAGRIRTLFVAADAQAWGVYVPETGDVRLDPTRAPGNEDLLDVAACEAFARGADVFVVPTDAMPVAGVTIAASLRY